MNLDIKKSLGLLDDDEQQPDPIVNNLQRNKKTRSMSQHYKKQNQGGVVALNSIYGEGHTVQRSNIACFNRKNKPSIGKEMRTQVRQFRQDLSSSGSDKDSIKDDDDDLELQAVDQQLKRLKYDEKKSCGALDPSQENLGEDLKEKEVVDLEQQQQ